MHKFFIGKNWDRKKIKKKRRRCCAIEEFEKNKD